MEEQPKTTMEEQPKTTMEEQPKTTKNYVKITYDAPVKVFKLPCPWSEIFECWDKWGTLYVRINEGDEPIAIHATYGDYNENEKRSIEFDRLGWDSVCLKPNYEVLDEDEMEDEFCYRSDEESVLYNLRWAPYKSDEES